MKPVVTVATEWAWFEQNVLIRDAQTTDEGVAEFRALFYAGAKAIIRAICDAEDPNAAVDALNEELAHYGRDVMQRGTI